MAKLPFELTKRLVKKIKEVKRTNPPLYQKIFNAIEDIRENPHVGDPKVGDLKGIYCYDIRHNGTSYELAYRLERGKDGELLLVLLFGSRENFYGELKRYMK